MANMKSVRLKAKPGTALNDIADYIFEEKPDLPEQVEKFELLEGKAALFGSGDAPIVEMYIRYSMDDRNKLDDIDAILELAGERSDEIEIIVDPND